MYKHGSAMFTSDKPPTLDSVFSDMRKDTGKNYRAYGNDSGGSVSVQPSKTIIVDSLHSSQVQANRGASQEQIDLSSRAVLVVGDANAVALGKVVKEMLKRDRRVSFIGNPGNNVQLSVRKTVEWLSQKKVKSYVIFHSGLWDVLALQNDDRDSLDSIVSKFRSSLECLRKTCQELGTDLIVCAIPPVIDYVRQRDWRPIIFDVNCFVRKLSVELNFTFMDNNELWESKKILFSRSGTYYNRSGQILVATPIVDLVSAFLNVEPSTLCQVSAQNCPLTSTARQQRYKCNPKVEKYEDTIPLQGPSKRRRTLRKRDTGRDTRSNKGFSPARGGGLTQAEELKDAHFFRKPLKRPRLFRQRQTLRNIDHHIDPWLPGHHPFLPPR